MQSEPQPPIEIKRKTAADNGNSEALNFTLDLQELAQADQLDAATVQKVCEAYGPESDTDAWICFADGSACRWIVSKHAWELR